MLKKQKELTFKELKKYAKRNYSKGGDEIYETWDEEDYEEFVRRFGAITKSKADYLFNVSYYSKKKEEKSIMKRKKIENIELYEEYMRNNPRMKQEWIEDDLKSVSSIMTLDDGKFIVFEKPKIETHFCFDDSYDYEGACKMAYETALTKEYFKEKNLRIYQDILDCIVDHGTIYITNLEERKVRILRTLHGYDDPSEYRELTNNELKKYVEYVNKEMAKLDKRLETYWKRYGNTKFKTWTYWGEA